MKSSVMIINADWYNACKKNYRHYCFQLNMHTVSFKPNKPDEVTILQLYQQLLQAWNQQDAIGFANFFSDTGVVIGFDGSQMTGQPAIEKELKIIFSNHPTGRYVSKVRSVNQMNDRCILLNAVAGMIPAGAAMINPAINAVQTLLAVKKDSLWYIELFQNTPAQFHGRPELTVSLTNELNSLLAS
jgi:uncharacterized protein (TIGR02246 family)